MKRVWSLILAMTLWQTWEASGQQLFLTHAPSIIKGDVFYVDMAIDSTPEEAVTCNLTLNMNRMDFNQKIVIQPEQKTARAEFSVPSDITGTTASVQLKCGTQHLFSSVKEVRDPSSTVIFQTDKGKYKPGDQVLYRCLDVNSMLKPQNNDMEVVIADPSGTKLWKEISNDTEKARGILDGSYTLSNEAVTGIYSITVYSQSSKKVSNIVVEKYVLPKTYVELEFENANVARLPSAPNTVPLKAIVRGLYTNGQFVQGSMVLRVDGVLKLNVTEFTGTYRVDINLPVDAKRLGTSRQVMKVVAIVYERYTNNAANVSQSLTVFPKPFTARPESPVPYYFKTDNMYSVKIMLTNFLGGQLTDWDDSGYSIDISNYILHYQYVINSETTEMRYGNIQENPVTLEIPVVKGLELSDDKLKVWFEYKPTDASEGILSDKVPVAVRAMTSNSGDYISVILTDSLIQMRQSACLSGDGFNLSATTSI